MEVTQDTVEIDSSLNFEGLVDTGTVSLTSDAESEPEPISTVDNTVKDIETYISNLTHVWNNVFREFKKVTDDISKLEKKSIIVFYN